MMSSKIVSSTIITLISILIGCSNPGNNQKESNSNSKKLNTDSIELTQLVRNVYKWHESSNYNIEDHFKFEQPGDTIIIGVNWETINKDLKWFSKTNFFSKSFLEQYKQIEMSIDSSIKSADLKWRNINDGISIWDTDVDDWCICQDSPDKYWESLTLNHFSLNNGVITFYWTWNNDHEKQYQMKAVKEDGKWKISYIQGFSLYSTYYGYSTLMKEEM